jgi:hypothetical protein
MVALFSTKAKYRALMKGAKKSTWLRYLFQVLRMLQNQTTNVHVNNHSCIKIAKNHVVHAHTKHIEVHITSSFGKISYEMK